MFFMIAMSQKELHRLEVIQKIHDERLRVVQAAELLDLSPTQVHLDHLKGAGTFKPLKRLNAPTHVGKHGRQRIWVYPLYRFGFVISDDRRSVVMRRVEHHSEELADVTVRKRNCLECRVATKTERKQIPNSNACFL